MKTFSLNNQFGHFIKELRNNKKWTLRDAAKESGLSASYISMLERGQHSTTGKEIKVTPEAISKLATAYEFPFNVLMIRAGYGEVDQDLSYGVTDEGEFNFIIHEEMENYDVYLESLQNIDHIPLSNPPYIFEENTIGTRIKELRENKKISRKELSDHLTRFIFDKSSFYSTFFRNISENNIEEIEENEVLPDSDFIIAASDFFKVSCDWLLRGKEYEFDVAALTKSQKILLENQKAADVMIQALANLKQQIDSMNKKLHNITESSEE